MPSTPITYGSIFRVLVVGFSAVIVLLLAAGFIGVKNAQLIQESSATLVQNQLVTTRLVEELQSEQETLNAAFYKLSNGPELVDRDRVLNQLDGADRKIGRIVQHASGTVEEGLWSELNSATVAFSTEARRLLALKNVPNYSSRDLFRRHEEVTSVVAKLVASGYDRALNSQNQIEQRSARLVKQSFVLLGGCLVLAMMCAFLTVRITTELFRRMEAQSGELARVTWHMLENQETTARRFSHELHDELGQCLTAVKANILALSKDTDSDKSRLDDCKQLIDEAIRNVRELSQLLRPTILDDFGLDAGLNWLGERFMQRTGIHVEYKSNFHERLPDETETHLFRIVQEALTNIAQHSGATQVLIDLQREDSKVHLMLKDNGHGFQRSDGNGRSGMGLIGMRARARSAGGELKVQSAGTGVAIELWAPVRNGRN